VEVVAIGPGGPSVLWSLEGAGFETADLPGPGPTWATGATLGFRHALLTGEAARPAFLVRRLEPAGAEDATRGPGAGPAAGTHALLAIRHDGKSGFRVLWEAGGFPDASPAVAIESAGESAAALVRARFGARTVARIAVRDARPVLVARAALGTAPFAPIAVRPAPGEPMLVVAEGAAEQLFAIRPPARPPRSSDPAPAADPAPAILWQRPGRGSGDGTLEAGPVAADVDGDRTLEVLAAGHTPSGAAALTAYGAGGATRWRRVFEHVPGARPVHNQGALTFFWPGRFRSAEAADIFLNTRRGLMHSDVGHLLAGRTGEPVWTRQHADLPGEFHWGYAGTTLAVADLDGRDGRDELVNLYPVCFWLAAGATGELIRGRELASRKTLAAWAAYGEPMVHDFTGDGRPDVLLDSPYLLALLDGEGKPLWQSKARRDYPSGKEDDNSGETTATRHALVDFDGDGRPELASAGYGDGVRAIDPRDGKVLWSLAAPQPTRPKCAAADLDGKPGDELLFVAGDELVAVTGSREAGRILWRWRGPAALSLPAIADLDGDGRAEVAVQSADGVVHVLDGPAH
jgi:hypothetical protein